MTSTPGQPPRWPTAKYACDIELELRVGTEIISGRTAREFFIHILDFIQKKQRTGRLRIPFKTSGDNYLLAESPRHPAGHSFAQPNVIYNIQSKKLYINATHPRFFALRQGYRLLESVGFNVDLVRTY